jgi:hypothetical protein
MPATSDDELKELGARFGLPFPSSARLLGIEREQGMDDLVRFKVELPASDWPALRDALPIPFEYMRAGTRGYFGQDRGFWDPHAAGQLRSGQVIREGARALNIGVDEGHPNKVVLYVVEHGT